MTLTVLRSVLVVVFNMKLGQPDCWHNSANNQAGSNQTFDLSASLHIHVTPERRLASFHFFIYSLRQSHGQGDGPPPDLNCQFDTLSFFLTWPFHIK